MSDDIRLSHSPARFHRYQVQQVCKRKGLKWRQRTRKPAPSFYVTESRDLPLDVIELRKYRLRVGS